MAIACAVRHFYWDELYSVSALGGSVLFHPFMAVLGPAADAQRRDVGWFFNDFRLHVDRFQLGDLYPP